MGGGVAMGFFDTSGVKKQIKNVEASVDEAAGRLPAPAPKQGGFNLDWISDKIGDLGAQIKKSTQRVAQTPPGQSESPGTQEQFYDQNQDWFTSPTNAEGAYGDYSQFFRDQSQAMGPSYQQNAYNQFASGSVDPNLGAFYDRQWQDTSDDINKQFGARGAYNSSAALERLGDARVGLAADRANREADYGLRRAQLGGNLAQGASSEALAGRGQQLGAAGMGMDAAGAADSQALARMISGGNLAGAAQLAKEGRLRGRVQDQVSVLAQLLGLQGGFEDLFSTDLSQFGMPYDIEAAATQDAQNRSDAEAQHSIDPLAAGTKVIGLFGGQGDDRGSTGR